MDWETVNDAVALVGTAIGTIRLVVDGYAWWCRRNPRRRRDDVEP